MLAAFLQPSCTKERPYDACMDEVSAQTSMPKESLAELSCASLLDKLNLPLPKDYVILKEKNAFFRYNLCEDDSSPHTRLRCHIF